MTEVSWEDLATAYFYVCDLQKLLPFSRQILATPLDKCIAIIYANRAMSRCPCEHEQPARAFSAAAAVVSLVLIHDDLCQTTVTFIHRGGGQHGRTDGTTRHHIFTFTCARKLTAASLILRTQPKTDKNLSAFSFLRRLTT